MNSPPPPSHLSAEAIAFILEAPEPAKIDYSDHDALLELRKEVDIEWQGLNEQMTEPWVSREETVAGVPAVRFASSEDALDHRTILVHLHGGSYFVGSPMANASIAVPIAQRTGLPVVSIDYGMAPDRPFPAGVNDALDACVELLADHQIAGLFGESAGGGLALTTAIGLRDGGHVMPDRLGLLSPWVDLTNSGDSYRTLLAADPEFDDPDEFAAVSHLYAGDDIADPRASPLFADLQGLPPTLIQVGGREILLSDSCRVSAAMHRAGTEVTLDVWDGLWHVWQLHHHVPEAQQALTELAAFLVPVS